jgi:hypothetical protein
VCQIKDSPCHDEASVYYVAPGSETKTFQMKMNKGSLHGNMQYHGKLYRKIYLVRQDKTAD